MLRDKIREIIVNGIDYHGQDGAVELILKVVMEYLKNNLITKESMNIHTANDANILLDKIIEDLDLKGEGL